ncbi:MAG: hypothetical protein NTZ25_03315 [Candidatus Peregrinibacteria bacterium]|nr:hypothetical protein [Candidatus Peregrinibacteria bacterium]
MKKLLTLLGFVFTVTIFSACSINGQFQDGPSTTSVSGVLSEQTSLDKESGTHFLTDESGKKTAARSLTINLSGDQYLNNKVKAIGLMNTTDDVFEITGLSVEEILSKNTKQNKQIEYKDTDAGFRLSYFDDWKAETSADKTVTFTAPLATAATKAAVIKITQFPFAYEPTPRPDGTLIPPLESYYGVENKGKILEQSQILKIGTDKMDAFKAVENDKTTYTLYRSGYIYKLMFTPATPSSPDDENTFAKMLADFQFVAMDATVSATDEGAATDAVVDAPAALPKLDMDMTTFESLPYQFSGQYPAKWYYTGVKSATDAEILHHYGFSDDASGTKELISLDVLSDGIPSGGAKISFSGKSFDVFEKSDKYVVYATLKTRNFRLMGPSAYKDLILFMAASLQSVEKDKPL